MSQSKRKSADEHASETNGSAVAIGASEHEMRVRDKDGSVILTLALPAHYITSGHVITEAEASAINAKFRGAFTSNVRSMLVRGKEGKYRNADGSINEAKILEDWTLFLPGAESDEEGEGLRYEAGERALRELFAEHNAAIASGQPGILRAKDGTRVSVKVSVPEREKGSKEKRDAMIDALLAAPAHADRVQRAMDALIAERAAKRAEKKPAKDSVTMSSDTLAF